MCIWLMFILINLFISMKIIYRKKAKNAWLGTNNIDTEDILVHGTIVACQSSQLKLIPFLCLV